MVQYQRMVQWKAKTVGIIYIGMIPEEGPQVADLVDKLR
jgi:hypothetical protein